MLLRSFTGYQFGLCGFSLFVGRIVGKQSMTDDVSLSFCPHKMCKEFVLLLLPVWVRGLKCFAEHSVMITSCPLFARKLDRNGKSEA